MPAVSSVSRWIADDAVEPKLIASKFGEIHHERSFESLRPRIQKTIRQKPVVGFANDALPSSAHPMELIKRVSVA